MFLSVIQSVDYIFLNLRHLVNWCDPVIHGENDDVVSGGDTIQKSCRLDTDAYDPTASMDVDQGCLRFFTHVLFRLNSKNCRLTLLSYNI